MTPSVFGLNRLATLDSTNAVKGFWIGKVVDDGADDSQGRIKVRIEALFGTDKEGVADDNLPWVQMMPSCGLYIRPQKDDFVTVVFLGSIYEGFYIGHTVHANSKSENSEGGTFGGQLNDYFFLNFHNSFIKGKYDGSEFEVNVNKNTTVKIDGSGNVAIDMKDSGNLNVTNAGNTEINTSGNTKIDTSGSTDIKSGSAISIDGGAAITVKSASSTTLAPGANLELNPSVMMTTNKTAVIPTGMGPFCALPYCAIIPLLPHSGQEASG